jgi:hypothetical protein
MAGNRDQSRIYKKIYESYHNIKIPKGMHIHHIDGNRHNHDIINLLLCTPEEHQLIHKKQGDPVAHKGKFIQNAAAAGKIGGKSRSEKKIEACRKNMTKNRRPDIGALASVESRRKNKTFFFSPEYQKKMQNKLRKNQQGPYSKEHKLKTAELGRAFGKKPTFNGKCWNSSYEASLETGIPASTIRYRCRNKNLQWNYKGE